MIVRASIGLRTLFCAAAPPQREPEEPWRPVIVDSSGPKRLSIQVKSRDEFDTPPEYLKDLVPQWMAEALLEGDMLIIPMEEFLVLDEQIKEHLDIISS